MFDKRLTWSGFNEDGSLKHNGAIGSTRVKYLNCKIIKTYEDEMSFWTEDCEFVGCLFEQNSRTLKTTEGESNGLISFVSAKLVKNTFNNLVGKGTNTSVYSSHGVVFMTTEANGG